MALGSGNPSVNVRGPSGANFVSGSNSTHSGGLGHFGFPMFSNSCFMRQPVTLLGRRIKVGRDCSRSRDIRR